MMFRRRERFNPRILADMKAGNADKALFSRKKRVKIAKAAVRELMRVHKRMMLRYVVAAEDADHATGRKLHESLLSYHETHVELLKKAKEEKEWPFKADEPVVDAAEFIRRGGGG
jgi:hypothetical protein